VRQVTGRDLALDPAVSAILRCYRLESMRSRNKVPAWKMSLVLSILSKAPFEPVKANSIKTVSAATISRWIKQTIVLAYKLANNEDLLKVHQVRAILQ